MMKNFKQLAQNVIEIEQQAIAELSANLSMTTLPKPVN